jgi:hypothetical protein
MFTTQKKVLGSTGREEDEGVQRTRIKGAKRGGRGYRTGRKKGGQRRGKAARGAARAGS